MQHLPPQSPLDLAPNAQAVAHRHGLLVRGVEAENRSSQLPVASSTCTSNWRRGRNCTSQAVTVASICTVCPSRALARGDAGFVLVAQRQVQSQVDIAAQPHLYQGFWAALGAAGAAGLETAGIFFKVGGQWREKRGEKANMDKAPAPVIASVCVLDSCHAQANQYQNLILGMYLHEFCGSWMEHPFWRAKFVLKDPKDLERIQATAIDEVWIDTSKGLDVAAG